MFKWTRQCPAAIAILGSCLFTAILGVWSTNYVQKRMIEKSSRDERMAGYESHLTGMIAASQIEKHDPVNVEMLVFELRGRAKDIYLQMSELMNDTRNDPDPFMADRAANLKASLDRMGAQIASVDSVPKAQAAEQSMQAFNHYVRQVFEEVESYEEKNDAVDAEEIGRTFALSTGLYLCLLAFAVFAVKRMRRTYLDLDASVTARQKASCELQEANVALTASVNEQNAAVAALQISEQRFRELVENSQALICTHALNGDILSVNATASKQLGWSADELATMSLYDIVIPGHHDRLKLYLEAISKTEAVSGQMTIATRSGEVRVWSFRNKLNRETVGRPYVIGYAHDVTERVRAEERATKAMKELQDFKAALDRHAMVSVADPEGTIIYANSRLCAASGYAPDELLGRNHRIFNSGHHPRETWTEFWRTIRSGQMFEGEIRNRAKDGSTYWSQTTVVPFMDQYGRPKQYIAIRTDITRRKEAEEVAAKALAAAAKANSLKSEFLANMSHEIRTPLNGVIGMIDLALDTKLTAEQKEYLEIARFSSDALLHVINDILDFSKIESGKLEFEEAPFDLKKLLDDIASSYGPQFAARGIEFICEVDDDVAPRLMGDQMRLRQVISNLVNNALKFTETGEVVLRCSRGRENNPGSLHFSVTDTGIGVPPEKRETIFEAFRQADGSMTRKYGGTGLGLSICSDLVKHMNGEIWLDRNTTKGSSFHFTVRLKTMDALPEQSSPPAISLEGKTVLIVDDNSTNRFLLARYMEGAKALPVLCEDARQALAVLADLNEHKKEVALALVDLAMPVMDGLTLAEKIRSTKHGSALPLLMLSSSNRPDDKQRCAALPRTGYLRKPIRKDQLFAAIDTLLGTSAPAKPASAPSNVLEPRDVYQILVAEDSRVNQVLAQRLLEKMGHDVTIANNGEEALQAFKNRRFDAILMDVQMPKMDGFETTIAIREWEKSGSSHIPIMAVTAHAMKGDRERCLEAGMDGYLSKPLNPEMLKKEMDRLMGTTTDRASAEMIDEASIMDRVAGDRELLTEMVSLFREHYPQFLADAALAVQRKDAVGVKFAAHALKNIIANFNSERLVKLASLIEEQAAASKLDSVPELLKQIEVGMPALEQALVQFLSETGAPACA